MRVQGENLNAYHVMSNTIEGAVRLGSIRVAAAVDNSDRQQAFMDTLRDIVSDILKDGVGSRAIATRFLCVPPVMRNSIGSASLPSGPHFASILSMWRCGCGLYRPM
jgi:hypothetical protein